MDMGIVDQYICHTGENLWNFEVVTEQPFENAHRIHPLKQRDVSHLIEAARQDEGILGMIVFGSAVRFDCSSGSDLDVLIVREDKELKINGPLEEVSRELDLIFSSRLGGRLREEIGRTGVIVYRRDAYV